MIQDRNGPIINLDASARSASVIFLFHQRFLKCVFLNFILLFSKSGGRGWPPSPSPCAGPAGDFFQRENIFISFRFSKFTLIYIHSGSAYVKNRGTAFPCFAFVVLIFGNLHFLSWLGWTSTESHSKEMHRRHSGGSVVPRTDLKTEGEQANNRETGYREYRFKRNS